MLVAAHGNSLRALVMVLEKLTPDQIIKRELGTGVPLIYRLNANSTLPRSRIWRRSPLFPRTRGEGRRGPLLADYEAQIGEALTLASLDLSPRSGR